MRMWYCCGCIMTFLVKDRLHVWPRFHEKFPISHLLVHPGAVSEAMLIKASCCSLSVIGKEEPGTAQNTRDCGFLLRQGPHEVQAALNSGYDWG